MGQESKKTSRMKTVSLIVLITLLGKVMGLVRDMLLGHNFATGTESMAFQVASRIPRTFFDAIFASAISASFIPVFADRLERHGREDAFALSRSFFTWVGLLTALFSVLGIALAEPIVALLADGFDEETAALCVKLLRLLFPTVFFTGIAFSMVGVLQSLGEFYIPAAISVVSNGIVILYYLFFCRRFGIYGLTWAFLLGWAAQALIQVPWLRKNGFGYRPRLRHPGLRQVFLLMLPVMVSTWIQPVNQLISTRFATHLFEGAGASAMDYANTLYTMIAGILVLSVTNVIFPEMSRLSTSGKSQELGQLVAESLRSILFLLLPMMLGLMLMARPLVRLLYEWKSWDAASTEITARALSYMSLGMVGYGVQNVLSRAFYAEQDGKTPLISGVISIVVNLVLCLLLADTMDVAGLSLATAVSATVSGVVLLIPMVRRYPGALNGAFWWGLCKMAAGSVGMAAVVYGVNLLLAGRLPDGVMGRILALGVPAAAGILVYFLLAMVLGLPEAEVLGRRLKRKGL